MVLTPRIEIPLDPDAPEARRWLEEELAKPEYQNAKPSAFDLAMLAVRDWIASLFEGAVGLPTPVLWLLGVLLVVVLVVVGLLVFGVPRLRRRRPAPAPLFDDGDLRDLTTLRRAAAAAAASGDWPLAIEERFRALVRGMVERDLVRVHPGSTAHGIADAAARRFPGEAEGLRAAAVDFDAVRYLGRAGSSEAYARVTELEQRLAQTAPAGAVMPEPEPAR
ncbi:DUF4129 domain-containing protein [Agromyces sp. Marseille-P2726]|uniref:DUF4129 domain-containing protein n=1 Tax=Agromyces sp. Marseille-P2726 TaxID=2709132 RepID=UPI0020C519E5|nr:DUF4129 domain-containing protein [Agromyces sp. Marseille-P2726]